uniref:Uncharacterized protein n=1 Tax=Oryza nivara TaxID=4536 RepID=A0A0E0IIT8_ORYNI
MSQRNISRCSSGSVKLGHGAKAHVPCSGWMVHRSTDVSMSSPVTLAHPSARRKSYIWASMS